nr:alpha-hydroxy acid oxidase [Burkholderia ubonensis]
MNKTITCIEDLRLLARRRLPRMFYDFVDSGSWTQQTYRANSADFQRIRLRQRVAVDIENRSTACTLLGRPVTLPVAVSPTGGAGFLYADGEIHAARAAAKFGVPYALSIGSQCSLEDVRANTSGPLWFQISILKDRGLLARLIERAKAADCDALILTMDFHVAGQRHIDIKNGLGIPPGLTRSFLVDLLSHPRWCLNMMRTRRRGFGNFIGHVDGVYDIHSFARWYGRQPFELKLGWACVDEVRRQWPGKLILKGILDPDDACRAVQAGADAISVSNQGGRQLDGAPSSIEALPRICEAVGGRIEVFLDGGVRSGQDVLKALAMGAKGVLLGRAALYGLAAMGEAGVTAALEIVRKELDCTMAFCGRRSLEHLDESILWRPDREPGFERHRE